MSRSVKKTKPPGFDYCSRRPNKSASGGGGYPGYGPDVKRRTHRAERRQGTHTVRRAQSLD